MSDTKKLLVCGERDWVDHAFLSEVLDGALRKFGPVQVIDGGNPGPEEISGVWAHHNRTNGVEHIRLKKNWRGWRRNPGQVRNRDLLSLKPDLVIIAYMDNLNHKLDAGLENLKLQTQFRNIELWLIPHPIHR